jgi:hypothetical protein
MASVEIYRKQVKVQVKNFLQDFWILEDVSSGDLFWRTDFQTDSRRAVIKIWVQRAATLPEILFVPPDWDISINGQKIKPLAHESIENLHGKIVELVYKDYTFVLHFES